MELRFIGPDLGELDRVGAEVLVCSAFRDERPPRGVAGLYDWRSAGRLSKLMQQGFATGELGEVLMTVKETLRGIPNRGIGYSLLRYLAADETAVQRLAALPQPGLSFNYLGQLDGPQTTQSAAAAMVTARCAAIEAANTARGTSQPMRAAAAIAATITPMATGG